MPICSASGPGASAWTPDSTRTAARGSSHRVLRVHEVIVAGEAIDAAGLGSRPMEFEKEAQPLGKRGKSIEQSPERTALWSPRWSARQGAEPWVRQERNQSPPRRAARAREPPAEPGSLSAPLRSQGSAPALVPRASALHPGLQEAVRARTVWPIRPSLLVVAVFSQRPSGGCRPGPPRFAAAFGLCRSLQQSLRAPEC
jgi:hypothetical protein